VKVFIPIKYNSQRVPNKNFRIFGSEYLFKRTLLKYADCDVYVDTDSEELKELIVMDDRLKRVNVFSRVQSLRGDEVSVCDLIKNFILKLDIKEPIIQTHVTSPFLKKETVVDAYQKMKNLNFDSVVSCNGHQSRFWRNEEYGYCPINHNPLKMEQTQDLPTLYEENSAFYIFRPEVILNTGNRVGKNPYFYQIGHPENLDIDTEQDWDRCVKELKS
jgi:CMP-N-acetylneuraminic acid synthetase